MNATKTQIAQIGDICRRRGIEIEVDPRSLTREDGDRLVRALLWIDGDRDLTPDLELVRQLEATREEKPMTSDTKTCTLCGESKPLTAFYKGQGRCKPCYNRIQQERQAKKKAGKAAAKPRPAPEPKPEPAFTPADEDLDLGQKLRDPRLSTIIQAQRVLTAKFGDVGLEDTAEVLAQIADLDLT